MKQIGRSFWTCWKQAWGGRGNARPSANLKSYLTRLALNIGVSRGAGGDYWSLNRTCRSWIGLCLMIISCKYIPQSPNRVMVLSGSGINRVGHIKSAYRAHWGRNWILISVSGALKDRKTSLEITRNREKKIIFRSKMKPKQRNFVLYL